MTRSVHHEGMIEACKARIAGWKRAPLGMEYPSIPFVVPQLATGERVRLCGKSGPYCEIIANSVEGRGTVAYWDARKVLKFLEGVDTTVTTS